MSTYKHYIMNFILQKHVRFLCLIEQTIIQQKNHKQTLSNNNNNKNNDAILRQVRIVQQASDGSVALTTINPGSLQVIWLFEHCFGLHLMDADALSQTQSWQPYWNFSPNCHLKSQTMLMYYLVLQMYSAVTILNLIFPYLLEVIHSSRQNYPYILILVVVMAFMPCLANDLG